MNRLPEPTLWRQWRLEGEKNTDPWAKASLLHRARSYHLEQAAIHEAARLKFRAMRHACFSDPVDQREKDYCYRTAALLGLFALSLSSAEEGPLAIGPREEAAALFAEVGEFDLAEEQLEVLASLELGDEDDKERVREITEKVRALKAIAEKEV